MRPRTIGVFTNNPHEVFQRNIISGAQETAARRGYEIAVVQMSEPPTTVKAIPTEWQRFTGVLIIANVLPDRVLRELHEYGLPLSLVSHQIPDSPIPGIMPNNRQGIAVLMEHLIITCGCRKPVFIQGHMAQNDGLQRETAFRQEVMRYNLAVPPEFYLRGDFIPALAAQSMTQFLHQQPDFDAILAADYLMAEAAVTVLRTVGLAVPDDVAVVGFGDGPEAAQAELTTVAADVVELGRRGARQLIGQIEGLRIRGLTLLSTELVERATTRRQTSLISYQ